MGMGRLVIKSCSLCYAFDVTARDIGLPVDDRVDRCLAILHEFFPSDDDARRWLQTPHPDLGGQPAMEVLRSKPDALLTLLTAAQNGFPL
jgi:uncharacterized protein (DUF2384 family)